MARTNIDIDDDACRLVMRRYGLHTKRDAVNFALRELAVEVTIEQAHGLRGSGWTADVDDIRQSRVVDA